MTQCTVGVMAYNEEQNIVQILEALLHQEMTADQIVEIVVVASGCTDRTVELARSMAQIHPIIRVEVQAERAGKAAAINHLIKIAHGEVVVLAGADTLPDPTALEHVLKPFSDPTIGMTGARVVPLNDPRTMLGFTVQLLWHVHHRLALRWPKLGELVAFRKVIATIPVESATDEVALEAKISEQGYRLVYVPEAIVYNRGPQTLADFLSQRRRIFAGHLQVARKYHYLASSMPFSHLVLLLAEIIRQYPGLVPQIIIAAFLELTGRLLGTFDYLSKYSHYIWKPIRSTKEVQAACQPLMLVIFQCQAGSIDSGSLIRRVTNYIPSSAGVLLWWDLDVNQMLFALPDNDLATESLKERIGTLIAHITRGNSHNNVLSYRVVQLPSSHFFSTPQPFVLTGSLN